MKQVIVTGNLRADPDKGNRKSGSTQKHLLSRTGGNGTAAVWNNASEYQQHRSEQLHPDPSAVFVGSRNHKLIQHGAE